MSDDTNCFKPVKDKLQQRKDLVIFDVGCNINPIKVGKLDDITEMVLNSGLDIKQIYGFEPVHFQAYKEKYKGNDKVTLVEKALSNSNGEAKFHAPAPHGLSSLIERPVFKQMERKTVTVQTQTIDSFMEENNIEQIDFLKIDVEGAELMVLKGAEKALKEKRILFGQFEFGGTLEDAGTSEKEILEFLSEHGYETLFRGRNNLVFQKT